MAYSDQIDLTLQRLIAPVAAIPGVVALSLGGSAGSGFADHESDLDVHVYWRPPLDSADARAQQLESVADPGSIRVDIRSWGLEDHLRIDGRLIELIYVHLDDLHAQVERAYDEGLGDEGYTTAQLYSVAHGRMLHDSSGALSRLQQRLMAGFPEATRRHLLRYHPVLLRFYLKHIAQAQRRGDVLFVQHRRYTVQMVFFNVLFTLNRIYHPGEKRILTHLNTCRLTPTNCAERWTHVARLASDDPELCPLLESLCEDLITLIEQDGMVNVADYPY